MNMVNIVISCILGVAIIVSIIMMIIINDLKHKEINLYNKKHWINFIEQIDNFIYLGSCEFKPNNICHEWVYGKYRILVWLDKEKRNIPMTSIHTISTTNNCVLSSFNTYRSKEMAQKLLHKLWKENKKVW